MVGRAATPNRQASQYLVLDRESIRPIVFAPEPVAVFSAPIDFQVVADSVTAAVYASQDIELNAEVMLQIARGFVKEVLSEIQSHVGSLDVDDLDSEKLLGLARVMQTW